MLHEPASYGMRSPGFQALEAACPSLCDSPELLKVHQ